MKTVFSRTDLTVNDKVSRLIHKIEGRLLYFQEQVDFRSKHPEYDIYRALLAQFQRIAENHIERLESVRNYFNYNKTVDKGGIRGAVRRADEAVSAYEEAYAWVREWPVRQEHIEEVLGIEMPVFGNVEACDHSWLMQNMAEGAYEMTVAMMKTRLSMSLCEAVEKGWFIVFGTLTVNSDPFFIGCDCGINDWIVGANENFLMCKGCEEIKYRKEIVLDNLKKVFGNGSDVWRTYINKIKRDVGIAKYGSWRAAKSQQFFDYCAVVEEGALNGRLHIHVVLMMAGDDNGRIAIEDPNKGLKMPYRRELDDLERYWEYGISQYIPVRFSNSDSWGKMGWSWPFMREGLPLEPTDVGKLSNYLVKYILKSKLNDKGVAKWRTRCNKEMGKRKMENVLHRMQDEWIVALVMFNKYPRKVKLYGEKVPTRYVRAMAVKELVSRYRRSRKSLEALPRDTTLKQLMRSGTHKKHEHRLQNTGSILVTLLKGRDISKSEVYENWLGAREHLERCFPVPSVAVTVGGGSRHE